MKYGINCTKDVANNALIIQGVWSIDNIQFISNESQKKLICSPFTKTTHVAVVAGSTTTIITIMPAAGCTLANDDLITFLIDDFKSTQDVLDEIDKSIGNLGEKPVGGKTIRELLSDISTNALTDSDLSDLQTALVALIGAATDSSSATTLFGKLAALLADTSTLKTDLGTTDGKVDTANTNISAIISNLGAKGVNDSTIRELLAAIKNDALTTAQLSGVQTAIGNLISALSDKIGTAADGSSASTVFGKIAGVKGDTADIIANLGAKGVSDLTVRQLLNAISTNALTLAQLQAARDVITNLIGAASDSSSASTVFGKIAAAKAIIDKIDASLGTDANSRTVQQKCSELLQIIGTFAFGWEIEANQDGEDTNTLIVDDSVFVEGDTLIIS